MTVSVRCAVFAVVFMLWSPLFAQDDDEEPPFDVSVWLRRADHSDFPWSVSIYGPNLTWKQRHMVSVSARVNLGHLKYIGLRRDLHFVMKVGNADSRWVPEHSHTHIRVDEGTSGANNVFCESRVYLRPGRYVIALIVYDAILKKGNIWRKVVTVRSLKKDPLPMLDRSLPDVEFVRDEPGQRIQRTDRGKPWLPVKNSRSICVDVVANLSAPSQIANTRSGRAANPAPGVIYSRNAAVMLAVSSVLSHLEMRQGRVRVSMLDTLRMEMHFDRRDAAGFDWQEATDLLAKQDLARINADVLRSQTQASTYLHNALQNIVTDPACADGPEPPFRVIILIGSEIQFPGRTIVQEFVPPDPDSMRFVYFCLRSAEYDDVLKMLKPAKPQRTYVYDALSFRKTLADLIEDLEAIQ